MNVDSFALNLGYFLFVYQSKDAKDLHNDGYRMNDILISLAGFHRYMFGKKNDVLLNSSYQQRKLRNHLEISTQAITNKLASYRFLIRTESEGQFLVFLYQSFRDYVLLSRKFLSTFYGSECEIV